MVKRKAAMAGQEELLAALSSRLAASQDQFFFGQQENQTYLLDLLRRTVDKGESNSLLVLGPRGAGKTALVRRVLNTAAQNRGWRDNAVVVHLSGHIQTDDKLALRDITKQLNLENVVGDKVFGSFAEHLSFLLASLKTGDSSSKPIVFVLDQFDSFCSHKNQTLLYNLFDVAQSRAVPITVLGISSRIDVTELLEKRVKSRFSHRHLYIWPVSGLANYLELATALLRLGEPQFSSWDKSVAEFLASNSVKKFVEQRVYNCDNSISGLKQFLYLAVLAMAEVSSSQLEMEHLEVAVEQGGDLEPGNSLTALLRDLSITELCLLIAIKHLTQIYDGEPFNFEMVYHEFVKFKRRKLSLLPEERSVLSKCWEQLLDLELVMAVQGGPGRGRGLQDNFALHTGQVPAEVLDSAVKDYPQCPTEVVQWLSSSHHAASH